MGQKLKAVGECFAAMEDFRQAEVRHLLLVKHYPPII